MPGTRPGMTDEITGFNVMVGTSPAMTTRQLV
jgi:hypothetical protein